MTLDAKVLNQLKGSYLNLKNSIKWTEAVIWKNEAKHKNIIGTNPCFYKNQGHIVSCTFYYDANIEYKLNLTLKAKSNDNYKRIRKQKKKLKEVKMTIAFIYLVQKIQ